jgi:hypothetical protein
MAPNNFFLVSVMIHLLVSSLKPIKCWLLVGRVTLPGGTHMDSCAVGGEKWWSTPWIWSHSGFFLVRWDECARWGLGWYSPSRTCRESGVLWRGLGTRPGLAYTTDEAVCYGPQPYAHLASICQSIPVYVSPILVSFEPATFVYLFSWLLRLLSHSYSAWLH